ncbi:mannosyltransferase putative-domain-containing protein [Chlamydoabsidia padenii]|nr:mannosyltransferase putative-domain-containing protein [Chlamydoabsidia padenii]
MLTFQTQWQSFISREKKKSRPKSFRNPRGIVLVAGNGDTFYRALTTIKILRHHGCTLPVEVWHLNDEQPSETMVKELHDLQAQPRDLSEKHLMKPIDHRTGSDKQFQIKVAAIINAGFENIIYLDSDNIPTADPTFLFDHPAYQETGAMFWPDFWKTHAENGIFDVLDIDCQDEWEQESGQMVINKIKSWYPLQLSWFMNHHHDIYYQFLNGDKDTFRYAWKALKVPFYMNPTFLNKTHFLYQQNISGQNMIIERPWTAIKQYTQGKGNTWLLPYFYVSEVGRACMNFKSDQGEPPTRLLSFDSTLPRLQELYFGLGGIGGETR